MRLSICLLLLVSACSARRIAVDEPTLAYQTERYIVVQASADRFVILTKSKVTIDEIQKRLGCGKQYVCSGGRSGEMWTIERLK
jgi:hypothetical protein